MFESENIFPSHATILNDFNFDKDGELTVEEKKKDFLKTLDLIPLCLYGLSRVHEEGVPIRPIVSFVSSPDIPTIKILGSMVPECL